MKLDQCRVTVAGGAGFIGGHLVRALLDHGASVTVLDNFHTGRRDRFEDMQCDRLSVLEHDICDPMPLDSDLVINLACPASPEHYQATPIKTWKASVVGTLNLAEAAQACGARFLQASTSEVYGDPEVHPQSEDYVGHVSFTGPRACYDEGKRAAETFLLDLHRTSGFDVRIARIFNTFGPGMALLDGRAVSNFILQALQGKALTIYGDGAQTRSFCFVEDMVRGLLKLATLEAGTGVVVNLGNPDERPIREIAGLVRDACGGSGVDIVHQPAAADDPQRRCPDITRARQLLGWSPEIPLDRGLKFTVEEFRHRIANS